MSSFSKSTVETCIKLRDELHDILKCNYCNKLLQSARTLNCPHHVCESCAIKQSSNEGSCIHCNSGYFTKDVTNNVSINSIIGIFHDLSSTITKAANLMNIKISPIDKDEKESDEEDQQSEQEYENTSRKRKLSPNNNQDIIEPKLKKLKLNTNPIDTSISTDNNIFIPTEICMTGYDKNTHSKFESYAKHLGITLNKRWKVASTQMLISKYNVFDGKPNVTFKVLASILVDIPVVKQAYLEDSYEENKILDYNKYICNYQRIDNSNGMFKGLKILFATTNMPTAKLKTLLTLGKATILETKNEINNKNIKEKENRIMICSHDIEYSQARQSSKD
eukprot:159079_1